MTPAVGRRRGPSPVVQTRSKRVTEPLRDGGRGPAGAIGAPGGFPEAATHSTPGCNGGQVSHRWWGRGAVPGSRTSRCQGPGHREAHGAPGRLEEAHCGRSVGGRGQRRGRARAWGAGSRGTSQAERCFRRSTLAACVRQIEGGRRIQRGEWQGFLGCSRGLGGGRGAGKTWKSQRHVGV